MAQRTYKQTVSTGVSLKMFHCIHGESIDNAVSPNIHCAYRSDATDNKKRREITFTKSKNTLLQKYDVCAFYIHTLMRICVRAYMCMYLWISIIVIMIIICCNFAVVWSSFLCFKQFQMAWVSVRSGTHGREPTVMHLTYSDRLVFDFVHLLH